MENICHHLDCTGCAACGSACPVDAIAMMADRLGHMYPRVDRQKCIDCGLCAKICPANHPPQLLQPLHAYAVTSADAEDYATSASGGAASVLARHIVKQGGAVYGCAQYSVADIRHIRVTDVECLDALKGSKYVQSRTEGIYRQVKKDLQKGMPVLFTGTPCQVAGLKGYLRKDWPTLFTMDLVCHGVPPQKLLREDVVTVTDIHLEELTISFREKTRVGVRYLFALRQKDTLHAVRRVRFLKDAYLTAFMAGLTFRESCHRCPYAESRRAADITVADFWGVGRLKEINPAQGVSLTLLNTSKGEELFTRVRPYLMAEERCVTEAVTGNGRLQAPFPRPLCKDDFTDCYLREGLQPAVRRFARQWVYRYKLQQLRVRAARMVRLVPGALWVYRKLTRR